MDRYTPFSPKSGPGQSSDEQSKPPEVEEKSGIEITGEDEPSRVEYLKNMLPVPQVKPAPKRKWPLWVMLAAVGLALLGGGYWLKYHKSASPKTQAHRTAHIVSPTDNSTASITQYVSNGNDLNLDFSYPSNWTATPPSGGNKSDQTITLTSPLFTFTAAGGTNVTGKVVASVRPGTANINELNNTTVAAQTSVQFAYSKPTSAQFQYPYLTFVHTPIISNVSSSFNEVLVTGTSPSNEGDSLTPASVQVDPIISASFYSCTTQTCTGSGASPIAITKDTWQNNSVFQQTLAIFQSMQLN